MGCPLVVRREAQAVHINDQEGRRRRVELQLLLRVSEVPIRRKEPVVTSVDSERRHRYGLSDPHPILKKVPAMYFRPPYHGTSGSSCCQ